MAIRAPVLPAETQASASPCLTQIDGDPHRGVFLAPDRQRWRLIHGHHFRGMPNGDAADGSVAEKGPNALCQTNQDHAHVGMITHETERCRNGHRGAVVPPHAVYGYGNGHQRTGKRKGRQFTIRGSYLPNPKKSLA
jgi:hypothetical protein